MARRPCSPTVFETKERSDCRAQRRAYEIQGTATSLLKNQYEDPGRPTKPPWVPPR